MEKRTEKNQKLYAEIDARIEAINKKTDNSSFNNTNDSLTKINPSLFQNEVKEEPKKEEIKNTKNKNLIKIIILGVLIIIILVVAVILWQQEK